jgi:hypothetical protein
MSTAVKRTLSATEAAKHVAQVLGLDDVKRTGTALATAAAEEAERNPSFAARVRALYSATMPLPTAGTRKKTSTTNTLWSELKLIKHVDGLDLNAAAPLNPYLLNEAFGADQLPKILDALPLARLKESAAFVEERNPGTKPVSRSSKSAVMDYIIHYVN